MSRFENDVAVVTGAGSGIGREIAIELADEGASVVVADVDDGGGRTVVEEIEAAGGEATFVHVDVTATDDVEAMVRTAVDTYGKLDVAVNNAGIGGEQAPTGEYPEASWSQVIDVNLSGVWRCLKAELVQLSAQGDGGAIVNMASVLGLVGFADAPAYTAAKHAVMGLTRALAMEVARQNITVNAVCPGTVATELIRGMGNAMGREEEEVLREFSSRHLTGRPIHPRDVAAAVVWLASEPAARVNGASLFVDDGWHAS